MAVDYEWFKGEVYKLTKIDLNAYKEKQMKRRIDTLIGKTECKGYDQYMDLIKKDQTARETFITYLTINVSEFFRNIDQWNLMDKQMVPELMNRFGKNLKIWSAACSTGDEPYTIVMLLSNHVPLNQINVMAWDIDTVALAKARAGVYDAKEVSGVPADLKKKYLTQEGDKWRVCDDIKKRVNFKQADLLREPYPKYYASLAPGGVLFIGSTEQIINYKEIGFIRKSSFYYEKPM